MIGFHLQLSRAVRHGHLVSLHIHKLDNYALSLSIFTDTRFFTLIQEFEKTNV